MALVLAFRPQGLFGRSGVSVDATKTVVERAIGVGVLVLALLAPMLVTDFWMDTILTQAFILGIGAASLIFLSAYGGMISLAQAGLMGIAGYALGNMVIAADPGRRDEGPHARLGPDALAVVLAHPVRGRDRVDLRRGRVAELRNLLPDADAHVLRDRVPVRQPGDAGGRLLADRRHRQVHTRIRRRHRQRPATASTTSPSVVALVVYALIRYLVRTPFGISLQGIRDEPAADGVARVQRGAAPDARLRHWRVRRAAVGGVLFAWWSGQLSPSNIGLQATIELLDRSP